MNERSNTLRAAGLLLSLLAILSFTACQTAQTAMQDRSTRDAVIGTVIGAAAGAAVDDNKRARGALIGAVVGGLAGGAVGTYLERQATEIQDAIPDATLTGKGDTLIVGLPGDLLFDSGSSSLSPGAAQNVASLGDTLVKYPETKIVIKGHTDSTGDESMNLRLSDERARNVKNYLVGRGVADYRITSIGMGEQFPVATNSTEAGRPPGTPRRRRRSCARGLSPGRRAARRSPRPARAWRCRRRRHRTPREVRSFRRAASP